VTDGELEAPLYARPIAAGSGIIAAAEPDRPATHRELKRER
jgi:hypothetical protein